MTKKPSEKFSASILSTLAKPESLAEKIADFNEEVSRKRKLVEEDQIKALKGNIKDRATFASLIYSYTLWDAVVAWRDNLFYSTFPRVTRRNYLTRMLKLIEENIIDPSLPLSRLSFDWYQNAKDKIDYVPHWASATKQPRQSCLHSFYICATNYTPKGKPLDKPTSLEIMHMLSSVEEKTKTKDLDPVQLTEILRKINERDALIVALLIFTRRTLNEILELKKKDINGRCINFENASVCVDESVINLIEDICKNDTEFLFVTANKKPVNSTQVIRNLKTASKLMGLDFLITPKVIQSWAVAYMPMENRSNLAKALSNYND